MSSQNDCFSDSSVSRSWQHANRQRKRHITRHTCSHVNTQCILINRYHLSAHTHTHTHTHTPLISPHRLCSFYSLFMISFWVWLPISLLLSEPGFLYLCCSLSLLTLPIALMLCSNSYLPDREDKGVYLFISLQFEKQCITCTGLLGDVGYTHIERQTHTHTTLLPTSLSFIGHRYQSI